MLFTLFFNMRKKYHKRNEHAKNPWYSVIFPLQVQKLKFNVCIQKRLKHCNLQCFRLLPRTKQRYLRCFFTLGAPKEPKHGYLRCFCNTQKSTRSKNAAICDTLARQHVRNAVFYSVFEPPLKRHWYLQCF